MFVGPGWGEAGRIEVVDEVGYGIIRCRGQGFLGVGEGMEL